MQSNMKNLTQFFIALPLLLLGLNAQAKPLSVFACEPEWAALTYALAGGADAKKVKVYSATTNMQDPHHIEARPSLIAKTRRADLLVCTGAELEIGWLPLLLRQANNPKVQEGQAGYFMAAEQVSRIGEGQKVDRSMGDVHASGNPHVHLDPERVLTIAQALSLRLQEIDADNRDFYQQQLQIFTQRWRAKMLEWRQQAKALEGKQVVVYHQNWRYLLDWVGMVEIGDLEPKPGLPPTSSYLAKLLKKLQGQQLDMILTADYQPKKAGRWLAKRSDGELKVLPFSVADIEQEDALINLYDAIFAQLK